MENALTAKDPRRQGKLIFKGAKIETFLEELAGSANIARAARLAGVSKATVYNHRRADPDFAARWDESLAQGWDRLESALLARALEVTERGGAEGELAAAPMTVKDALALINRNAVTHQRVRTTRRASNVDAALAKLYAMVLAVKRAEARKSQ